MDTFFRRLIGCLFLFVATARVADASWYPDAASAVAACTSDKSSQDRQGGYYSFSCATNGTAGYVEMDRVPANGWTPILYPFGGSPPPATCAQIQPFDIPAAVGFTGTQKTCSGGSGGQIYPKGCSLVLTQFGNAFQLSSGTWKTHAHVTASGETCTKSTDGTPDTFGDAADHTPVSTMPAPQTPPPPPSPEPKICQNGTCYDPNTGDVSVDVNNSHLHVPINNMKSGDGGACFSDGSSSLCAGAPVAKAPPSPPITDPATQVQSVDHYPTVTDTGAGQSIVVVVYTSSGATPSSGQGSGDSGPASGSSSGGAPKSFSGGGDCDTPPACTGDAVMCGAARTQWASTCQLHRDLTGSGAPTDLDALKNKHVQSDVWSEASDTDGASVGASANAGNYDQAGLGYDTACPLTDMTIPFPGGPFDIPVSKACIVGPWIRACVVGFALFSAARITWAGRAQ